MDLRGITVPEIRLALKSFLKEMDKMKSVSPAEYERYATKLSYGDVIEWVDFRTKLFIAFTSTGRGRIKIVTAYWKGVPDPKSPGECRVKYALQELDDLSGFRTFVREPHPTNDTNYDVNRVLPTPPWKKQKNIGPMSFNVPGDRPDGKSLALDLPRTTGIPGEQYEGPPIELSVYPTNRRPSLDFYAAVKGKPFPSGPDRQKKQRSQAKMYYQKYYRKNKSKIKKRMERWYKKWDSRGQFKRDKQRRRDYPEKFKRKPGGPATIKERSQNFRDKTAIQHSFDFEFYWVLTKEYGDILSFDDDTGIFNTTLGPIVVSDFLRYSIVDGVDEFFEALDVVYPELEEELDEGSDKVAFVLKQRPSQRQRKTRGQARTKQRLNYRKNKAKIRLQNKKRYMRVKNNPTFKKQQSIRHKYPERFRRKTGSVFTVPEIAFVIGKEMLLGYVRSVSPMTGMVTFNTVDVDRNVSKFQSLSIMEFFSSVVFLSGKDESAMIHLIDTEIGLSAYDSTHSNAELVEAIIWLKDIFPHSNLDPSGFLRKEDTDGDYVYGNVRTADFYLERIPVHMDQEGAKDRATNSLMEDEDAENPIVLQAPDFGQVYDNSGSGSGKVIPWNKGFTNKEATTIPQIVGPTGDKVKERSGVLKVRLVRVNTKSLIWTFVVDGGKDKHVVKLRVTPPKSGTDMYKADVQITCDCKFFNWQGPSYWAQKGQYLLNAPKGEIIAPNIKDPDSVNRICKHLVAVFKYVKDYTIPKETLRKKGNIEIREY